MLDSVHSRLQLRFASPISALAFSWLLLLLVFLPATPLSAQPTIPTDASPALLTNVMQIRKLTLTEANAGHPLQINGVMTYCDQDQLLFVQDFTGGIYIWPGNIAPSQSGKLEIEAGDIVEIKGITQASGYSPIIVEPEFKVLGKGSMPLAKKVSFGQLMAGQEDGQWIEIEGIVRSDVRARATMTLILAEGGNRVTATIRMGGSNAPPYLDSKVRLRGVSGVNFNERKQMTGIFLLVPGLSHISVTDAAPPAEIQPLQSISGLLNYSPRSASGHRVRVRGAVTLQRAEKTIFIQDATGGLCVQLQKEFRAQIGDQLEVIGFPLLGGYRSFLQDAVATRVGHSSRPGPLDATPAQLQNGRFEASLVRLQGRILDHERNELEQGLFMQAGQLFFKANLANFSPRDLLSLFAKGSLVEVTGVYQSQVNGSGDRSFQLLFDSPADIRVLNEPSWWTARRLGWTIVVISIVSCLGLAWVIVLSKTNAKLKAAKLELRRARDEVEARVETRTIELANANASLKDEIVERKRVQAEMQAVQGRLIDASRQAGMAEVATSVLHNVGNVLNSVNVSSTIATDNLKKSKVTNLSKAVALLSEHEADLGAFLTCDPRGKQLPSYLAQLAEHLVGEQAAVLQELAHLQKNIEHIKEIVAMQQSYARVSGVIETVQVSDLVEDALRMNASALERHHVQAFREYVDVPPIAVEKHKVLQILVNLIRNAKYACDGAVHSDKRLTVRVVNGDGRIKVSVIDSGVGIPRENLTRIFNHGFTTRKDGHGFGLHSGALAAKEMGGSLSVHSDGVGHGATFILELPLLSPKVARG